MVGNHLLQSAKTVLAIDPGQSGAAVRLGGGKLTARRDFKCRHDIALAIRELAPADYAIMEFVHAMPGQGVCSMFSFGRASGVADGALALALPGVPVEEVTPQKWQNYYRALLNIPRETEFDSRAIATQLFPDYADLFKRKKDHNTADAVLIAAWKLLQN